MSVKLMSTVFEKSQTTGNARLILLSIADACSDDGVCWPSVKTLARKANVSPVIARKYINALVEVGVLVKEQSGDHSGRQTSNTYTLIEEKIGDDCISKEQMFLSTSPSRFKDGEMVTRVSRQGDNPGYQGEVVTRVSRAIMNHQKEYISEPSSDSATAPSFSGELPLTDYVNGADAQVGKANALDSLPPNTANARTTPESQKSPPRKRKSNLVDDAFIAELKKLNPNKDVDAQIAPAKSWLLAHPPRQFTKAFFATWINRTKETEQEEIWKPRVI